MNIPFALPAICKNGPTPIWQDNLFRIGTETTKVLHYSINNQGWDDDLTLLHEETAGDHHFMDRASRDHAIQQLSAHIHSAMPTILEIGCSSGFMLQRIQQSFPQAILIGSDVVSEPLTKLAEVLPTIPLMRFDLLHCPLPDNSIDAIVILNVLEHIENDRAALQQIYRILKPGGVVVIEVPAGPHLFDVYDQVLKHYRRYKLSELKSLILNQGFEIAKHSHLGFFLYPGFWLVKQRNKRSLTASVVAQRSQVTSAIKKTGNNKLMHFLMQLELRLGHALRYPMGIRCLVTCVKPK